MSKITVTTLAGQTSGADANKVKIESGDTLESSTIGTASGAMSIKPAGTEVVNVGTTGDLLVKGTTNQRAALILRAGSNTANSQLRFGDQASDTSGRIMYDHSDDTMRFQTNGSERVRISAAGLAIGGTGAANTLDDYEEGTWSAELRGESSRASTPVISTTAKYRKIGDLVFVAAYFANVNTSGASGNCIVTGFPFQAINQLFGLDVQTYGQDYDDAGGVISVKMYIENNSQATLLATKDNAAWQVHSITAGSGKYLQMQGCYLTAS